jgi:multidrug efflux pump subunit AcrA (membrane-fusion protein)
MRVLKIIAAILMVGIIAIPVVSCASKLTPASENQVATVKRGDLTVSITASGNLALSQTADLAFEMAGTVQDITVEAGDSVTEGEVLASLDTSEWEDNLAALQNQLTKAQRALPQAQINLENAQTALEQAEAQSVWPNEIFQARAQVYAAEADVAEAQAVLQGTKLIYDRTTGEYRYQQALTAWDIKVWTQNLSDAKAKLAAAQVALDKILEEYTVETKITYAQENLREAQAALDKLLAESPVNANEIAVQKQKVDLAQQELDDAQNASKDIAIKKLQLQIAQGQLDDAQKAVADAQKALDEAKSASPIIKAPFAGFVTKVNVKGGDDVLKGTVALQIADPTKFEADILVSEMNIYQVKIGGDASVQVAALSTLNLPAKVTYMAPTATIQQGVVNYTVTVELQSLQLVSENQTGQGQRPQLPGGQSPSVSGNQTRQGQGTQSTLGGQTSFATAQAIQLRQGLSVTVTIITAQKTNVLQVPNRAIVRQQGKTYVDVLKNGASAQVAVTTGISNAQYTEVTSGLSEGEQVVIPKATTTTTTGQPSFFGIGGR